MNEGNSYTRRNNRGEALSNLINRNVITHIGPDFNTLTTKKGRPDIILVNRYNIFNTATYEGEITTSDHIPLVMKISTRPIVKNLIKRKDYRRADWEGYRDSLENKVGEQAREIPFENQRINIDTINKSLERWMKVVHSLSPHI